MNMRLLMAVVLLFFCVCVCVCVCVCYKLAGILLLTLSYWTVF